MSASAVITVADGAGAAGTLSNNAGNVTPGSLVTIALNSSTGVTQWELRIDSDSKLIDGRTYSASSLFSFALTMPRSPCAMTITSRVSDGQNCFTQVYSVTVGSAVDIGSGSGLRARGVCTSNMSLTAFVGVTGGTAQDGVTYVQGQRVLLANQTTAADCGIYVVGVVSSGTAPLTRAPEMPSGAVLPMGTVIEVAEGTVWKNSSWKVTNGAAGVWTVGTTDPKMYPRQHKGVGAVGTQVTGVYAFAATAPIVTMDTTANHSVQAVIGSAGQGSATIDFTGTGTDAIDWAVINW